MNNFQTILVSVFLAIFAFAVLIFSGLLDIGNKIGKNKEPVGKIIVWGTVPSTDISKAFLDITTANREVEISYLQKDPDSYQADLVEAFARDNGPDLFIITSSMVLRNDSFIYKIPYTAYPKKTFIDNFIDGASIYAGTDSITALPFAVDPMVVYYNKDIMTNQGIAKQPNYWNELFELSSQLTQKKDDGTINQSMIALGRYDNVKHAKDIISTLLLQNNNPIIQLYSDRYRTSISLKEPNSEKSIAEEALSFYTEFSNPNYKAYSWNRSMPNSLDAFTSGKLAFYLGRASELFYIQEVNPNLSFDVKEMFQTPDTNRRTYGDIYAMAINKKSKNIDLSVYIARLVSEGEYAEKMSQAISLPPVSRTVLASKPKDTYMYTFYNSALISRSWFDPDSKKTNDIFNEMFDSILSNKLNISSALA